MIHIVFNTADIAALEAAIALDETLSGKIVEIKDSPTFEILKKYNLIDELTVGEREVRFVHEHPMLSLRKFKVTMGNDENENFPLDIVNFFIKVKGVNVNCTPKFDGNSIELIYVDGVLVQALMEK